MSDRLAAFLDTLLPGGEGFPAASDINLAQWMLGRATFASSIEAVLVALPADFAEFAPIDRTAIIQALEAADRNMFGQVLVAAYSGYYVNPLVLQKIAETTGYAGRPPQPDGHFLPPFDPAQLDIVRQRPRSYR